jgi:hypothetical protein
MFVPSATPGSTVTGIWYVTVPAAGIVASVQVTVCAAGAHPAGRGDPMVSALAGVNGRVVVTFAAAAFPVFRTVTV